MEPWIWREQAHPIFYLFIVAPWALYLSITGLTSFLACDYRRHRPRRSDRGHPHG